MAGKDFPLSITLRTVDKATSGIKRINDHLDRTFGPIRKLRSEFGALGKNLGLSRITAGVRGLAVGLGAAAGVAVGAVAAFKRIADEFDDLGDAADVIGVSVDALAQLRYAAGQSGGEVEALDQSLEAFNKTTGQAKANTGGFASFLKKVSPELLKQIKGANDSEEAFDLLADAMAKLEDPAKKAALAAAAGFDPSLIPLLARGSRGVRELREEFAKNAGSQKEAAEAAGQIDRQWRLMGASIAGVKSNLLSGLAPVFLSFTGKATAWLNEHRAQIGRWAEDFGEKLPGRIEAMLPALILVKDAVVNVVTAVAWLVQKLVDAKDALDRLAGADTDTTTAGLRSAAEAAAGPNATPAQRKAAGDAAVRAKGGGQINRDATEDEGLLSVGGGTEGMKSRLRWLLGQGDKFLVPDSVFQAADRLKNTGTTALPDILSAPAVAGAAPPAQANVKIEVVGPKGTRVTTDPRSTADVETSVGYQMGPSL